MTVSGEPGHTSGNQLAVNHAEPVKQPVGHVAGIAGRAHQLGNQCRPLARIGVGEELLGFCRGGNTADGNKISPPHELGVVYQRRGLAFLLGEACLDELVESRGSLSCRRRKRRRFDLGNLRLRRCRRLGLGHLRSGKSKQLGLPMRQLHCSIFEARGDMSLIDGKYVDD